MQNDFLETRDNWNKIWRQTPFNLGRDKRIINTIQNSIVWEYSKNYIINKFGSFKNLKVIEIGCGRGEYSLPFALQGAQVTLLDYSEPALDSALKLYDNFGLKPKIIKSDIFNLPGYLEGNFDISASYGTVEHYIYPQRQIMFDIHYSLLNKGGSSIIGVPNKYSPAYRLFKKITEVTGRWRMGREIPFSARELNVCAKRAGFKRDRIIASSALRDSLYFLINRPVYFLSRHYIELMFTHFDIPCPLNKLLGYLLVLIADK